VRVLAVGAEPVGIIAIGANATGIIAIGQLATGVVAIGQLARGAIVLGQLALGLVAVGQLAVGVGWASGMVGLGGTSGPGLVLGLFGRLRLRRHRPQGRQLLAPAVTPARLAVAAALVLGVAVLWWYTAGRGLLDALTREGGILLDRPHVLR
jgi:hypothetical protein